MGKIVFRLVYYCTLEIKKGILVVLNLVNLVSSVSDWEGLSPLLSAEAFELEVLCLQLERVFRNV